MSEPKFTPGPWYADKYGKIWRNVPSDLYEYGGKIAGDMPLALVNRGWYEKDERPYPQQANANLIAAAPDMYEALEEAVALVCDSCLRYERFKELCCGRQKVAIAENPCNNCTNKVIKALRKARGEEE